MSRHYEPTVPPRVTYSLTPKVMELEPVLTELERIAGRWYGQPVERPATVDAVKGGRRGHPDAGEAVRGGGRARGLGRGPGTGRASG